MDLLDGLLAQPAALDGAMSKRGLCLLLLSLEMGRYYRACRLPFVLTRKERRFLESFCLWLAALPLPAADASKGRESLWRWSWELLVGSYPLLAVQGGV